MENQDIKPQLLNSNPHPKPTDDAQSLVETIIPSTEEKDSTTTKVEQNDNKTENDADESIVKDEENSPTQRIKSKEQDDNKGNKIETVAP